MAKYRENPLFKETVGTAYTLGQALSRPRSKKAVDVGKYKGLEGTVQGYKAPSITKLGTTTTPYGGTTRYEKFHPGIDIANVAGTPIPSQTGGVISEVVSGKIKGSPGYGNYVIVTDPQGSQHRYSHLQRSFLPMGTKISRGQAIGTMGATGQTYSLHGGTGTHLDYRIRDAFGKYVDPLTYLRNLRYKSYAT